MESADVLIEECVEPSEAMLLFCAYDVSLITWLVITMEIPGINAMCNRLHIGNSLILSNHFLTYRIIFEIFVNYTQNYICKNT